MNRLTRLAPIFLLATAAALALLAGCQSVPAPAEAKVEGGTAKVEQSSVSVKPSEERQNTLRVVIKGIPPGTRVVPVVD